MRYLTERYVADDSSPGGATISNKVYKVASAAYRWSSRQCPLICTRLSNSITSADAAMTPAKRNIIGIVSTSMIYRTYLYTVAAMSKSL